MAKFTSITGEIVSDNTTIWRAGRATGNKILPGRHDDPPNTTNFTLNPYLAASWMQSDRHFIQTTLAELLAGGAQWLEFEPFHNAMTEDEIRFILPSSGVNVSCVLPKGKVPECYIAFGEPQLNNCRRIGLTPTAFSGQPFEHKKQLFINSHQNVDWDF